MKIIYENEWERAAVHVDIEIPYEEDYQMRMLGHNRINSLLKVTGNGRDGQSRYTFYPGDSLSMEKQYSRQEMKREDIERFTEQFIAMVDIVKAHLLDPDRILLTPELIFIKDGAYRFCYLPVREMERKKSLFLSFHEMTEYFVKKLDYQDTEGILLVYRLHKETLKENYDLKKILEEYHKEEVCKEKNHRIQCKTEETEIYHEKDLEKGGLPDNAVFCTDDDERDGYDQKYAVPVAIGEERVRYGPIGKAVRRIKNGRWGKWEDLITEIDGQEAEGHL